jgi:hypothetical protein
MKHEESKIQKECVRWFKMQHATKLICAIPNGGKRGVVEASIMKAEGVLAGMPDLFIAEPSKGYHGMFVEMKTKTGKLTTNQQIVHDHLFLNDYHVVVCRSIDEFMKLVNEYFFDSSVRFK